MTRYVTIDYRGTEYELLFDLYAMEMIEDEFGSMPAMAKEMDSGKSYKSLKKLFKILVNAVLLLSIILSVIFSKGREILNS